MYINIYIIVKNLNICKPSIYSYIPDCSIVPTEKAEHNNESQKRMHTPTTDWSETLNRGRGGGARS